MTLTSMPRVVPRKCVSPCRWRQSPDGEWRRLEELFDGSDLVFVDIDLKEGDDPADVLARTKATIAEEDLCAFVFNGRRPGNLTVVIFPERPMVDLAEHKATHTYYAGLFFRFDKACLDGVDYYRAREVPENPESGKVVHVTPRGKPARIIQPQQIFLLGRQEAGTAAVQPPPPDLDDVTWRKVCRWVDRQRLCDLEHGNHDRFFGFTMRLVHEWNLSEKAEQAAHLRYNNRHYGTVNGPWSWAECQHKLRSAHKDDLKGHIFGYNFLPTDPRWTRCIPLIRLVDAARTMQTSLLGRQEAGTDVWTVPSVPGWLFHRAAIDGAIRRVSADRINAGSRSGRHLPIATVEQLAQKGTATILERYLPDAGPEVPRAQLELWLNRGQPFEKRNGDFVGRVMKALFGYRYDKKRRVYVRPAGTTVSVPIVPVTAMQMPPKTAIKATIEVTSVPVVPTIPWKDLSPEDRLVATHARMRQVSPSWRMPRVLTEEERKVELWEQLQTNAAMAPIWDLKERIRRERRRMKRQRKAVL